MLGLVPAQEWTPSATSSWTLTKKIGSRLSRHYRRCACCCWTGRPHKFSQGYLLRCCWLTRGMACPPAHWMCCAESLSYPRPWRVCCSSLKVVKVDEINASTHTINGRALLLLDTGNHDSEPPMPPVPAAPMSPKRMSEHHSSGEFATIPGRLPCHAIGNHAKPCQASLYA